MKYKLQEETRQLFPSLLESECKPQLFPYLAFEFAGSSVFQRVPGAHPNWCFDWMRTAAPSHAA
jgi:hypothetical protein